MPECKMLVLRFFPTSTYHFGVTAEEQRSCRQELHYAGLKVLVFHMAEMLGPQKGT